MSKHTPGPWTANRMRLPPRERDRRCGFVINGPDVEDEALPTRVCDLRVPSGIDGFAEGEANARLIAAAPDLLAALEQAVYCLTVTESTRLPALRADVALNAARAAIAKARGDA